MRLLIACVGNAFLGDDAFGVVMAKRLTERKLPPQAHVVNFGTRSIDLTYALEQDYDAAILVDATFRGGQPGTVYVIEPEMGNSEPAQEPEDPLVNMHDLDPNQVLRRVAATGGRCRHVVLVGCEPETFGDELVGQIGLSQSVAAAVNEATGIVVSLAREILEAPPAGVRVGHTENVNTG